jgi:hypothetical protein
MLQLCYNLNFPVKFDNYIYSKFLWEHNIKTSLHLPINQMYNDVILLYTNAKVLNQCQSKISKWEAIS